MSRSASPAPAPPADQQSKSCPARVPVPQLDLDFESEDEVEEAWFDWVFPFGKYSGTPLREMIETGVGRNYCRWYVENANKDYPGTVATIMAALTHYDACKRDAGLTLSNPVSKLRVPNAPRPGRRPRPRPRPQAQPRRRVTYGYVPTNIPDTSDYSRDTYNKRSKFSRSY